MLYRLSGHNIATEPSANGANIRWIVGHARLSHSRRHILYLGQCRHCSEANGDAVQEIEASVAKIAEARAAISEVIYGQEQVIDQTLVTVLAGGHALLVGVPGLAKTLLVHTMGAVLGLDDKRVQFTPDLMPADILGSEVLEESERGSRSFRFLKGPVFCQLLMADEINRASPRTQSALLQAMQEKQVTVAGVRYELPAPFHVLATQNPLEQEAPIRSPKPSSTVF